MKSPIQISNIKKSLFFLMGILVAVFVVSQEIVDYHCTQICEQIESTEEESNDKPDQDVVYSLTTQVLLPANILQIEPFQAVFIGEVIREKEEKRVFLPEISLHDSPHYRTLFRNIQSPNAP
ncbi:hypothetical protein [Roseivirga misakiensis]|uniref:Uncharacterized protein n=1 Tax=Roseivirga misakiensis TaxID=1563681 RepID=A0A1E5T3A1_9BACT|nr:hypothetical protein [Roseivirga misakiensis]OEK05863.1 hypothetical protein BFP71_07025 [Roseivirga misakiensis]